MSPLFSKPVVPALFWQFSFDMDCVDVDEAHEAGHRPCLMKAGQVSNPGHMHSCGHDGHTTMGIAVCNWIQENLDQFCGTIKVVFQPAEEGVRGARPMTETGIFDDVDFFFGNHLGFNLPTGTISPEPGVFLASTKLDATFTGLAAHSGADPQKGKNALLAAQLLHWQFTALLARRRSDCFERRNVSCRPGSQRGCSERFHAA